jgi:sulfatase maturation enzyme AslB (radical SAM superfamily)
MSLATLAKAARSLVNRVEIDTNRFLRREFVPAGRDLLYVETSGVCNLKCRFCAYVKKQTPKVVMTDALFRDCIEQAVAMGYRRFDLTPCTGDVFMDRQLFRKLEFLDAHPGVRGYQFFTNFTILSPRHVARLFDLQRLQHLTVSIYGHDRASFVAITESTEKVYQRLLANLEALLARLAQRRFALAIGLRSVRGAPRARASDLARLLKRFKQAGIPVNTTRVYNNWGGAVTQDDVKGLAIDITGDDAVYKKGACAVLLTGVQVTASGVVNGCACRDVDSTLRIGDLNEQPLREILSTRNQTYMALIAEQQRGEFRPICRSCDFYRSIYHKRSHYRKEGTPLQSLDEFMASLDEPGSQDRRSLDRT